MKLQGDGVPANDGRYDLRRSTVLEVLTRHQVRVALYNKNKDLYLLDKEDIVFVFSLPELLTLKHVVRLADKFEIDAEAFYRDLSQLH